MDKRLYKFLLLKTLIWRFFIAIPMGILVSYIYIGEIYASVEFSIIINIISTTLYYAYEIIWSKISKKYIGGKDGHL